MFRSDLRVSHNLHSFVDSFFFCKRSHSNHFQIVYTFQLRSMFLPSKFSNFHNIRNSTKLKHESYVTYFVKIRQIHWFNFVEKFFNPFCFISFAVLDQGQLILVSCSKMFRLDVSFCWFYSQTSHFYWIIKKDGRLHFHGDWIAKALLTPHYWYVKLVIRLHSTFPSNASIYSWRSSKGISEGTFNWMKSCVFICAFWHLHDSNGVCMCVCRWMFFFAFLRINSPESIRGGCRMPDSVIKSNKSRMCDCEYEIYSSYMAKW